MLYVFVLAHLPGGELPTLRLKVLLMRWFCAIYNIDCQP